MTPEEQIAAIKDILAGVTGDDSAGILFEVLSDIDKIVCPIPKTYEERMEEIRKLALKAQRNDAGPYVDSLLDKIVEATK